MSGDIKLDKQKRKVLDVSQTYTRRDETGVKRLSVQDFQAAATTAAEDIIMNIFPNKVRKYACKTLRHSCFVQIRQARY